MGRGLWGRLRVNSRYWPTHAEMYEEVSGAVAKLALIDEITHSGLCPEPRGGDGEAEGREAPLSTTAQLLKPVGVGVDWGQFVTFFDTTHLLLLESRPGDVET